MDSGPRRLIKMELLSSVSCQFSSMHGRTQNVFWAWLEFWWIGLLQSGAKVHGFHMTPEAIHHSKWMLYIIINNIWIRIIPRKAMASYDRSPRRASVHMVQLPHLSGSYPAPSVQAADMLCGSMKDVLLSIVCTCLSKGHLYRTGNVTSLRMSTTIFLIDNTT